jgi:hypothetical protein
MNLATVCFILIAILWTGYFVLEGKPGTDITAAVAAGALLSAVFAALRSREGRAFALTAIDAISPAGRPARLTVGQP